MRDKHMPFALAAGASVAVVLAVFAITMAVQTSFTPHIYSTVAINNQVFSITALATNQSEWEHGLMNTTVTNKTLMLFEFNHTADYPFWMFDTYTNLDMIWVNYSYARNSGTVAYVVNNATSCFVATKCTVYDPHALANFVIEAKAGFASTNKIGVGSVVVFR